jgi:glyoxylase-like metal-dependent hydrolase (beta-lactamase superfamily II)
VSKKSEISFPFPDAPIEGQAISVAPGILWMRLPLPMALDHVNVYAIEDDDGWTLIDTGMNSRKSRAIWETLLAGPLQGSPIARVLLTHHHPDHVGLVGWFQDRGAELITTRTAWLYARMLTLDVQETLRPEVALFYARSGMPAAMLAKKQSERPFNFADVVAPMPMGFRGVTEGSVLRLGGRDWLVRLGSGHAPDHITLWQMDGDLVIGGDQLLPGISANIGVYPTEPQANPLQDWLTAAGSFQPHARPDQLVLPGHKLPFRGLPFRLVQMIDNHLSAMDRLRTTLAEPMTAVLLFPTLFHRIIGDGEYGLALVESVAHLNWLLARGEVVRHLDDNGAWLWQMRDPG